MALKIMQGRMRGAMVLHSPLGELTKGLGARLLGQMLGHIQQGRIEVAPFFILHVGLGVGNEKLG